MKGDFKMEYTLKNQSLELVVSTAGAEIRSLKKASTEYIWQGDPAYWGRRTPILFPFVGMVRGGVYRFAGQEYRMGQHGFARDQEFECTQETENTLSFVLCENEDTLKVYPFRFQLQVNYTLTDDGVNVEWLVRNPDEKPLYFSIGGHPAFNCPLDGRGTWEDYRIRFAKEGKPVTKASIRPITQGGCVGAEQVSLEIPGGELIPSDELFAGDALILENEQADEISLIDPDGKAYLTVSFKMPLFGVWSPVGKHAPFICIEPWCGRADRDDFSGELQDREFGQTLGKGEEFRQEYRIAVK